MGSSGRFSPTLPSLSSLQHCLVAAAPASPISKLRGISSLERKGVPGQPGMGRLRELSSLDLIPISHAPHPLLQEIPRGASRAATFPWRCQDAAARGPGWLQAATRSAQVSVATHGWSRPCMCGHDLDSSASPPLAPIIFHNPDLPGAYSATRTLSPTLPDLVTCVIPSPRALLDGLALNAQIRDLHLDLSGCEVGNQSWL